MDKYVILVERIDGVHKVMVHPHNNMYDPEFRTVTDLTCEPKIYKTLEGAKKRCEAEIWYYAKQRVFARLSVWTWDTSYGVLEKIWEPIKIEQIKKGKK